MVDDKLEIVEAGLAAHGFLGLSASVAVRGVLVAVVANGAVVELSVSAELLEHASVVLEQESITAHCAFGGDNLDGGVNGSLIAVLEDSGGDVLGDVLRNLAGVAVVFALHGAHALVAVPLVFGPSWLTLVAVEVGHVALEVVPSPAVLAPWTLGAAGDALVQVGVEVHAGNTLRAHSALFRVVVVPAVLAVGRDERAAQAGS